MLGRGGGIPELLGLGFFELDVLCPLLCEVDDLGSI